ncbi:methylmalonyl-CoA mutase family protein [Hyphobacterium sp. HN65]|uniref:Methylmalonyl-CoA mutase family protein n=1 Tax=Hyphobacterium lacteum TaxID=3116575 RepID=A0ABU7LTG6_9PROT|nr:methylmalonyl-CoA mutase family protein [Hyphobacterium sp. HN65]MEE2527223.1 methylmalonyl-CoA mutase family protein [Hyphobacterium sp. HN65]
MSDQEIHAPDEDMSQSLSDAWRIIADKALRGADFEETLVRSTADGIRRGPVFFSAPGLPDMARATRPVHLPWQIRQSFADASLKDANAAIIADLLGGVTQIGLHLDPAGRYGVPVTTGDDLSAALEGVDLSIAPVHIEPGGAFNAAEIGRALISLGAKSGGLGLRADHSDLASLASEFDGFMIASIDARTVHEAGGSEAQEIAYAASGFNEALGRLLESGMDAARAASQIETVMAVDADIHLSIAKLRAARLVLANILQAYDISKLVMIRAVTSGRMMTRQDPWTNIIRISAAAFAGAVGGADTMSIHPATHALGRPDRLARRTARNLHILLQEESHAGVVADPAAGSFLHDKLSEQLARQAWDIFQTTERHGGFSVLGDAEGFGGDVSSASGKLAARYRDKQSVLIGVSRHAAPDLREMKFLNGDTPPYGDDRFTPIRLEDFSNPGESA